MAAEAGLTVDKTGFHELMLQQRQRAKAEPPRANTRTPT